MNKKEAATIAEEELRKLRELGYQVLVDRVEETSTHEVTGDSGTTYQVETMVYWDGRSGGDLRVIAAVDDGGWKAFHPLSRDFIIRSDGSLVE